MGFETAPYETARWVDGAPAELDRLRTRQHANLADDRDGATVFLARNAWDLNRTIEAWPTLRFTATRERA
jgi:peptide chain release factor 3